jgi:hypothetical protein
MDERNFLSSILARLDRPNPRFFATRWPLVALWLTLVVFFMFVAQLARGYQANSLVLALGSFGLGLASAWVGYAVCWARQWPLIRRHLDRQSLQSRLQELER